MRLSTLSLSSALPILLAAAPVRAAEPATPLWHLPAPDRDVRWSEAARYCQKSRAGDRSDWRLPAVHELEALALRAERGDSGARETVDALAGAAAWSRNASPSGLAWAASFEHAHLLRIHVANARSLRALCTAGPEPERSPAPGIEEGDWLRPLGADTDSALMWPCQGEYRKPVAAGGSLYPFQRWLPPGPIREPILTDFVVCEDGLVRFVAPAVGSPKRYGDLAVKSLMTFVFAPATCDGRPIAVFYQIDFAGKSEAEIEEVGGEREHPPPPSSG
jgi:hypothetical protein